jgi:hypothetical protein
MFAVCASCDRGQRYRSEACRSAGGATKSGLRGKRYQASEAGKHAHCRRQQAYREHRRTAPVTHQAMATITGPDYFRATLVGSVRHLRVVEPLDEPLLPGSNRAGGRDGRRDGQISTLSDDR